MKWIIPLIIIAALAGGVSKVSYTHFKQRGIRNNNAGNIERGKTSWVGMRPEQTDTRFLQFVDAEHGIRALYRTLLTYRDKHGLNTIRGIVTRWAPPVENNTPAYINFVSRAINLPPDSPINSPAKYAELIKAIIQKENGVQPYPDATILKGMSLAVTS